MSQVIASKNIHSFVAHVTKAEQIALAVVAGSMLVGVGLDLADNPLYEQSKGWLLAFLGVVLVYLSVPSLLRCGSNGIKSVWSVVRGSVLILALTLIIFYTSYYWIVSALPTTSPPPSDKVLNFPPMIAALWAASMGWYVHYQASAKNHRTTNSFNLVMQTRTSKEFLERAGLVQLFYPHGTVVPDTDKDLFHPSALKELTKRGLDEEQDREDKKTSAETALLIQKAKAADALKYLLNYYEFMAVGIAVNDLGEELLYETIGVTVTSIFTRAKPFIEHIRSKGGGDQPLAFEQLEALTTSWSAKLADEIHQKVKK
jgi:uncharacterized membrane protein